MFAGVAQSVVQLIRNQQVVCSSHITSSKKGYDGFIPSYPFLVLVIDSEHLECEAFDCFACK